MPTTGPRNKRRCSRAIVWKARSGSATTSCGNDSVGFARATIAALQGLKRPEDIAKARGKSEEEVTPGGVLRAYRETKAGPPPEPQEVA